MIIIPIVHSHPPATCPKCGQPEHIVETCKHCRHEYPAEEGFSLWNHPIWFGFVFFFMAFWIGHFLIWCMDSNSDLYPGTYIDFCRDTWEAILKTLRKIF